IEPYGDLVDRVRAAVSADIRPVLMAARDRLRRLIDQQRYEEAETVRHRLATVVSVARRHHRVASLAQVPHLVAAARSTTGWEIHVIRYGRLAESALARPGEIPQQVARWAVATAEQVEAPVPGVPAATIEETERIADWLERAGVRIMELDGDWFWPLHATIDLAELPFW